MIFDKSFKPSDKSISRGETGKDWESCLPSKLYHISSWRTETLCGGEGECRGTLPTLYLIVFLVRSSPFQFFGCIPPIPPHHHNHNHHRTDLLRSKSQKQFSGRKCDPFTRNLERCNLWLQPPPPLHTHTHTHTLITFKNDAKQVMYQKLSVILCIITAG